MCPSHTARFRGLSVTPRDNPVVTDTARIAWCRSQPGYLVVRVCPSHSAISRSIAHRLSAIDVGHTPRDLSRCVGHNRVISRYGCVRHTARYRGPSHTACPPSMSVTHRVIYRGVSVTTGLSRGPSHTSRCRGVSVAQHRVISWYVSHTACPPSMSVTHCVIYRGVSVKTG